MRTVWIIFGTAFAAFLLVHGFRTQLFCVLRKDLKEGRYPDFQRRSQSILYRFFLPHYILLGLQLDHAILCENSEDVLKTAEEIFTSQVSLHQKKESCLKAFGFFLQKKDRKQSMLFLSKIRECGDDRLHKNAADLFSRTFSEE